MQVRKNDWIEALTYVQMGIRSTISSAIGYAPNTIIFGRKFKLPWDNTFDPCSQSNGNYDEYVTEIENTIDTVRKMIANNLPKQERIISSYSVGDMVMVKSVKSKGLLKEKYFGPCRIVEAISPKVFKLRYKQITFIRNEFHLKKCNAKSEIDVDDRHSDRETSIYKQSYSEKIIKPDVAIKNSKNTYENAGGGINRHTVRQYPIRERTATQRLGFV